MSSRQVRCLIESQAGCGEAPLWDPATGLLWWVDISGERIHCHNPSTNNNQSYATPYLISALVLAPTGLLVATAKGIARFDTMSGQLSHPLHHPEPNCASNRMNDMAVAPDGSLWVGTMHKEAVRASGALYRYGPNGAETLMSDTTISNGLGWSPNANTLYFIDSIPGTLHARTNGTWRIVREFADYPGKPDGLAVDEDGILWIALCGGGKIVGMTPEGVIIDSITLPCNLVTSCAFGGHDLKTLFITTATFDMSAQEMAANRLAGGLFCVNMDVRGQQSTKVRWPEL